MVANLGRNHPPLEGPYHENSGTMTTCDVTWRPSSAQDCHLSKTDDSVAANGTTRSLGRVGQHNGDHGGGDAFSEDTTIITAIQARF